MKKNFVLDTNILIHNPMAIEKFEDNNVWIPHPVIEELDGLKLDKGETGYNAREAIRVLTEYRKKGNLLNGVDLPGGGKLYFYVCDKSDVELPSGWSSKKMDNLILLAAANLSNTVEHVILVSNDGNMQLKADALGIEVQVYKNDRVGTKWGLYKGRNNVDVPNELIDKIKSQKKISVKEFEDAVEEVSEEFSVEEKNEFFIAKGYNGGSILLKEKDGYIIPLEFADIHPYDLSPRNAGQRFLMEALMTSCGETPLVIVNGPAGTGKTLLALGCGLEQVMETGEYKRILLCRPNVTMDEDIGFLPGSETDKISPLLRGCYDNLEVLLGNKDDSNETLQDKIEELFARGYIQAQAVAYLRGRSITNSYIIIDEAQNATPNQILSIITRAGEGSKIVIMGDINQIDAPRLDSQNNGLSYAIEKMKGSSLCQIVSFEERECTRSSLAKEASERLKK